MVKASRQRQGQGRRRSGLCKGGGRQKAGRWCFVVAVMLEKTYLLELELSPPANIGIGIKGSGDAASYSGGIHLGQTRE